MLTFDPSKGYRLAASNIAWTGHEPELFLDLLAAEGAQGLEFAASLLWAEPIETTSAQRAAWRRAVEERGLVINGLHALLFARKDLQLLDLGEGGLRVREYIKRTIDVCADLGGRSLVLGGPRSRRRGGIPLDEAKRRGVDVLYDVGEYAAACGCFIALEALPTPGCDFIVNLSECAEMVQQVNSAGVCLHFDTGAADISETQTSAADLLTFMCQAQHCHVNDFDVAPPGSKTPRNHLRWSQLLKSANYHGWVSIEMRSPDPSQSIDAVRDAIRFVRTHYQFETEN